MAISLASLRRKEAPKPPIWVLYGPAGIGKTTLASGADNPVLIAAEDGIGQLDVPHWSPASFQDVLDAIGSLYAEEHEFKTLVIDSVDWLEPLIHADVCAKNGWVNIEAIDYGKGYVAAEAAWRQYIDGIRALRDDRGMQIIQIAHEEIKRYQSPDSEAYDRHAIKLHRRASALLQEHADIIAYVGYRVSLVENKGGFTKTKRGVGVGQRVMYFEERPSFIAKNRFSLPASIDLPAVDQAHANPQAAWAAVAAHLPQFAA